MKILLLSDPNSIHTIKWAKSLAQNGHHILIYGNGNLSVSDYDDFGGIVVKTLNSYITRNEGAFSKIKYLKALPTIKKIITEFKPDILHAHYASSYGLLAALTGFHPLIISVWGGDVFSFPKKSFIHKMILKFNLSKADKILSTSHAMAKEANHYTDKKIEVTPFGIDVNLFRPQEVSRLFEKEDIVVGTIKALESVYGIEYLIKAFHLLLEKYQELPLKLLIVGKGSLEQKLKKMTIDLQIEKQVIFTGGIPHKEVPKYHNMIDVFVALSKVESFGVAIIEASACETPVVVSNVGGLPEVVDDEKTGFVVSSQNPKAATEKIEALVLDADLRARMGKAGRERVKKFYNWDDNVNQMIAIYNEVLQDA